jgi:hypothetical protein
MRKIFSLVFLLSFILTSAQKSLDLSNQFSVKLNLFSLLDPISPGIQTGAEYRINERWAVEGTYGIPCYLLRRNKDDDSSFHNNKKIKGELKWFCAKRTSTYLGLELFYTGIHYNSFNGYYSDHTGSYYYTYAEYRKKIWGSAIKFGYDANISSRLLIDAFSAFGVRFVNTEVSSTTAVSSPVPFTDWISKAENVGKKLTPHVACGLRFGYILFK